MAGAKVVVVSTVIRGRNIHPGAAKVVGDARGDAGPLAETKGETSLPEDRIATISRNLLNVPVQ